MTQTHLDVIIIGAGHAGLSISYLLKENGISHIVFEKGRVGESWRSQRWDSFALNTAHKLNVLPGDRFEGEDADEFTSAKELVENFEKYVRKFKLPLMEHHEVISVTQDEMSKVFHVEVTHAGNTKLLSANQIVIASGSQNVPKNPDITINQMHHIYQVHAADYRNTNQLPAGNVLVVGSGQTGCQVAEDVIVAGRKVYLSTSAVGRIPRRYRGKDIMDWILDVGMFDIRTSDVKDPSVFTNRPPQVSGTGQYGHTVSLQSLAKKGVVILGTLDKIENNFASFLPNAGKHVQAGDQASAQCKHVIDQYISKNKLNIPLPDLDEADLPDPENQCVSNLLSIDLIKENITSIIWCTGFGGNFSFLEIPVLNEAGSPVHQDGIAAVPGVYFIGFPWLRTRKSGIICGIEADAKFIVDHILQHTRNKHAVLSSEVQ